MKTAPSLLGLFTLIAIAAFSVRASAQAPAPGAPAAQPEQNVQIPDSRGWTVEQAVVNLRSSDKGTRLASLFRLASEPGEAVRAWICEAAQYDPEARIRYEAVTILGRRNESASLPILMHIGDNDKDDRVRTAARTAAGMGVTPQNSGQPGQPAQPGAAPAPQPGQPAPPPPVKRYDENGNELPPGYMDEDPTAGSGGDSWGASVEMEELTKTRKVEKIHSGFMRQMGYDGAMGAPRDTLTRSAIGLDLAFGRGVFTHSTQVPNATAAGGNDLYTKNEFTDTDFDLMISGSWSPIDFLELGLEIEALTAESRGHRQLWYVRDPGTDEWNDEPLTTDEDDSNFRDNVYNDASYSGAAFGLLSFDIKTIFADTELMKMGLAVRVTFPTHTGERFGKGMGSHDLFLPSSDAEERLAHYTKDASVWGLEPGIVASFAPIQGLTIYTDIMFMMGFLKYARYYEETGTDSKHLEELSTINMYIVPHVGAQYRILDDSLGFQVAISPAIYLGKSTGAGLAAFGIVPGISYNIKDMLDVGITVDIQAGSNATKPFQCTDLINDPNYPESGTTPCGVGRVFGMDLHIGYDF